MQWKARPGWSLVRCIRKEQRFSPQAKKYDILAEQWSVDTTMMHNLLSTVVSDIRMFVITHSASWNVFFRQSDASRFSPQSLLGTRGGPSAFISDRIALRLFGSATGIRQ